MLQSSTNLGNYISVHTSVCGWGVGAEICVCVCVRVGGGGVLKVGFMIWFLNGKNSKGTIFKKQYF